MHKPIDRNQGHPRLSDDIRELLGNQRLGGSHQELLQFEERLLEAESKDGLEVKIGESDRGEIEIQM